MVVNFFPRKDVDVKICDYRYGKRFAVQQNTDSAFNKYTEFQLFQAFKYNFKATVFSSKYNTAGADSLSDESYKELVELGVFELQQYFPTDRWINPTTGVDELIPDFYSTTWTALGEAAFENAVAGQPKPTGTSSDGTNIVNRLYPNHGQEMYDVTNGRLGYDVGTNQNGTSNLSEFKNLVNTNQEWHEEIKGKKASVFSYRNGRNYQPEIYKPYYLAGRQSNKEVRNYYGTSKIDGLPLGNVLTRERNDLVNQPLRSRWVDSYIATSENAAENANNLVRNSIDDANTERGQYADFSHWHSVVNSGDLPVLEDLFKTYGEHLDAQNLRGDCWIAGYGELWEYFWFRELTSRAVGTVIGNEVYITLEWRDLIIPENLPLALIDTPLSVEIDLTGTPLQGLDVATSYGKTIDLGNDKYIVEMPFLTDSEGFKGVKLYEGVSNDYNTTYAAVTTSVNGSVLNVTTDQPTKKVLFCHAANSDIYNLTVEVVDVDFTLGRDFNLEAGNTYYIGVINDFGLKKLIEI